jgi:hypothetical protein
MWRIHSALHAGNAGLITGVSGPAVAQLRGLGGVGKSLLAQEYARRFGAAYPGGVIWLQFYGDNARANRRAYRDQLYKLAAAFGVIPEARLMPDVLQAVAGELERRGKPCLWVLDDVPDRFTIKELREVLPPHPIATTLFTTRSRSLDAVAPAVDLDVLPAQDAVALLTARREPADDAEWRAAREIAAALGGHALTLDVAGSALQKREGLQTFTQFLGALGRPDRDELEIAAELADALPSSHERNIVHVLRASIDLLDGAGRDFLDLAAGLESAPIPAGLVADTFARAKGLDAEAAADLAARGVADAASLSLAAPAEQAAGCWRVHVLVSRTQRFLGDAGSSDRLLHAVMEALGDRLDSAAARPPRATDAYEVVHAERLSSAARTPVELSLLGALGRYHVSRGNYVPAELAFERQRDAYSDLLGSEAPDTLAAETGLAEALFFHESPGEAEPLYRHVLEVRERTLGPRHPDTLTLMERLAKITMDDGRLAEARQFLDFVATAREQVLGANHPATMRTIRLQADWLIRGGKRDGLILLALILRRQESALGPEHPETLASLEMSARILETGQPEAAAERLDRVVAGRRRMLGEDHPDTVAAARSLAFLLMQQGNPRGFQLSQEADSADRRRYFGQDERLTPQFIDERNEHIQELMAQGQLDEAKDLVDQLLQASRDLLGDEDPVTLRVMTTFADVLLAQGHPDGARQGYQMVLTFRRRALGEDHPETESTRRKLTALDEP